MKKSIVLLLLLIVIVVSFSTSKSTAKVEQKKNYLILVVKNIDKKLYESYIRDREETFNLSIVSLEEKKIENQPKKIKKFLKELYASFPFYYAVFDENIAFYIMIYPGIDWKLEFRTDNYYVNLDDDQNYIPEFYLGRINHSFLSKQWISLPEQSVLFALPVLHYDHYLARCRGYWTSWCDLRFFGLEYKKILAKKNLKVTELYENRYSYRQAPINDSYQLNEENFKKHFKESTVIVSTSTIEPLLIDVEKMTLNYTWYPNLYTSNWQDADKDRWVDFDNKEITTEIFCDFRKLEGYEKRIWILPTLEMPSSIENLYCVVTRFNDISPSIWYLRDNQGLRDSFSSSYRMVIDKLLLGESISKCVFDSYNDYYLKYQDYNFGHLTYFVWGPPETTLKDLVANARMEITPEEVEDSSEIVIPLGQVESEFKIKNSGKASLRYKIEFDKNLLEISPLESAIEPSQEQVIKITLPRFPILPQTIPKKRQTSITIKSNAGDKTLKVIWVGA